MAHGAPDATAKTQTQIDVPAKSAVPQWLTAERLKQQQLQLPSNAGDKPAADVTEPRGTSDELSDFGSPCSPISLSDQRLFIALANPKKVNFTQQKPIPPDAKVPSKKYARGVEKTGPGGNPPAAQKAPQSGPVAPVGAAPTALGTAAPAEDPKPLTSFASDVDAACRPQAPAPDSLPNWSDVAAPAVGGSAFQKYRSPFDEFAEAARPPWASLPQQSSEEPTQSGPRSCEGPPKDSAVGERIGLVIGETTAANPLPGGSPGRDPPTHQSTFASEVEETFRLDSSFYRSPDPSAGRPADAATQPPWAHPAATHDSHSVHQRDYRSSRAEAEALEEERRDKQSYLLELEGFKQSGIKLTRDYSMSDPVDEIRYEMERIQQIRDGIEGRDKIANWMKMGGAMILIINRALGGVLALGDTKKFTEEWEAAISKNTGSIERVWRKYFSGGRGGGGSPEISLLLGFLGVIVMTHLKNKFGDILSLGKLPFLSGNKGAASQEGMNPQPQAPAPAPFSRVPHGGQKNVFIHPPPSPYPYPYYSPPYPPPPPSPYAPYHPYASGYHPYGYGYQPWSAPPPFQQPPFQRTEEYSVGGYEHYPPQAAPPSPARHAPYQAQWPQQDIAIPSPYHIPPFYEPASFGAPPYGSLQPGPAGAVQAPQGVSAQPSQQAPAPWGVPPPPAPQGQMSAPEPRSPSGVAANGKPVRRVPRMSSVSGPP